jgi:hypothetical protein
MKFSIFTPTHRFTHLPRLEASLKRQTFQDFEWVVVPNGPRLNEKPPITLPQARVISPRDPSRTEIGYLKKHACLAARGEILVEVDHDDELTPNALEELAAAFSEGFDFVYSNFCNVKEDGAAYTFGEAYGWRSRPFELEGKEYTEQISFPPSPSAFSKIWYAPNHVRAWRRDFYLRIGGHDESLRVLDDQDILARTYISGTVKHIDKPLYLYHMHPGNTCYGEENQTIQEQTLDLHDKYIYQLAERWSDLEGLRKIDLCGGHSRPAGYESIDVLNGDIIANLDETWPIESGSVGVLRAHDALEHLKNPIHIIKEAYRVLAPNGWFLILVPSTDGRGAFQDPTHVSFWNSNSFWYYTRAETARYINTPVRFQLNRVKNYFPSTWYQTHNILYTKADLVKLVEGERPPGLIEI